MDILAQIRWQQGRYNEARILHLHVVDGLVNNRCYNHDGTLSAMHSLGQTITKFTKSWMKQN